MPTAIIDSSAACHMPDVLEMPYRPPLYGSGIPGEKSYTYRLGSQTCLAGDMIGEYSFDSPLSAGDILVLRIWQYTVWLKTILLTECLYRLLQF